jgi:ankyrin repeat protein
VNNDIEAVKKYIAAKKNLNEKDLIGGSSPLITAALFGRTEIAGLLIDAGADLSIQNNDGSTALHVASFFCHPEIVKMLLKKGVNKNTKNKYGSTARESVIVPYKDVKNVYQGIEQMLTPIGLKLDYIHIEKTRPIVAALLK